MSKTVQAKITEVDGISFASGLEATCYTLLKEAGLDFSYNQVRFSLQPRLIYPGVSWEKIGKEFKLQTPNLQQITYKPDFVSLENGWIIETKGHRTPAFNLRWKLFKASLVKYKVPLDLYMPTTKKEIEFCIQEINKKLNEQK